MRIDLLLAEPNTRILHHRQTMPMYKISAEQIAYIGLYRHRHRHRRRLC